MNGQNDRTDLGRENQLIAVSKSSKVRFGPDPLITIPARGFWKCRIMKALQKFALDHSPRSQKLLALRAATTEVITSAHGR